MPKKTPKPVAFTVNEAHDHAMSAGMLAAAAARSALRGDIRTARVHVKNMIKCTDVVATVLATPIGPVSRDGLEDLGR